MRLPALTRLDLPDNLLLFILIGAGTLIVTLVVTGVVLVKLPPNYFAHQRRSRKPAGGWTLPAILRVVGKNLLGVILIVLGVLLSLPGVPGQGLLTILLGLFLVDFPGKFKVQRKIVQQRHVRRVINRLRNRFGRPELHLPA